MAVSEEILIVGGGIGGLAAALAFARRGAQVRVLERAQALREVGAGLQISPNGMRVLNALGLEDRIRQSAVIGAAVSLRRAESDREVARLKLGQSAPYAFVHRADLIEILSRAASEAGATIELNADVVGFETGLQPCVNLSDGRVHAAPLIVDAGGLHSLLRAQLNPGTQPFFTGQVAWRATVPNHAARGAQVHVHMAPGAHVVSYPIRGGALLNLVAVQEREAWAAEGWAHEDDPTNLRAAFAGACDAVTQMLAAVEHVNLWGLFRHEVAEVWTGGNTALLGDAAHPTLPFLAQGANMALEDAWALAACYCDTASAGLERYQKLRRPRVVRAINTANGNAVRYHLPYGPMRFGAHLGLKVVSTLAPTAMTWPFRWLYDYDVTKDAP